MSGDPVEEARAAMGSYAGGEDSPPMRVCAAMLAVCESLQAGQQDLAQRVEAAQTLPMEEVQRRFQAAARSALASAVPDHARMWRWRRWAAVVASAVACASAVGAASGLVSYRMGVDAGAAVSTQWTAWCASPAHVGQVGGKNFCLVPR